MGRVSLTLIAVFCTLAVCPAGAEIAPKTAIDSLLETLQPLTEDPGKAADALKALDAERVTSETALGEINASLESIKAQIAEIETKKAALEKRVKAVEAGKRILEAAFASPSAPATPEVAPAAAPAPATPEAPQNVAAAAPPAPEVVPTAATPESASGDPAFALFNDTVRPIFEARCLSCHSAEKHRGGLDMSTRTALLKGGDSGPAIIPGDADKSLLIKMIRHEAEPFMPHKEDQMPAGEIAKLVEWVMAGAAMPEANAPKPQAKREMVVTDKDREFWSYRPLDAPQPPAVNDVAWPKNSIDQFVLAKLEEKGIAPAMQADKRTLIRRAYFDLIGLPPTPEETEAFVNDAAPDAWERLIDKLLASPHYGERWGRHWLDLARYADSDGYEFDKERPNAFPYRDFVIKALNSDMPFDQFAKWQLAGDEYAPDDPQAIAATGFLAAGPYIDNQVTEQNKYDEMDDILSTTMSAFLATNVGCARCHDHKFDPVPTRDYYRLLSAFNTNRRGDAVLGTREVARQHEERIAKWDLAVKTMKKQLDKYIENMRTPLVEAKVRALPIDEVEKALMLASNNPEDARQQALLAAHKDALVVSNDEVRKSLTAEQSAQWDALATNVQRTESEKPVAPPMVFAMTDAQPEPKESFLLARGNIEAKVEPVQLGFLSVLPGNGDAHFDAKLLRPADARTTYQRTAVAEWMMDPDMGAGRLALRVLANRLWHYHFGAGIVRTPNDFGMQGERPTHPELLDWLAVEVKRNGWRLKPMHKMIMLSSAYQMGTQFDEAKAKADPDNHLWWRRKPQRMEAEILRDAVLAVSGCLNTQMYGPGIYPAVPDDAIKTGSTPKWPLGVVDGPATWRRSVYVTIRRSARVPMFEAFDQPDTVASSGRRLTTVTPTQGLEFMNSTFMNEQARHLSERVRAEAWESRDAMITRAYALAIGRAPSETELAKAKAFLQQQATRYPAKKDQTGSYIPGTHPDEKAMVDFCQVLLSLNEFTYVP